MKPLGVGIAGITIFTFITFFVFYFTPHRGAAYFISGVAAFFGVGYFIYKFTKISPLTALVVVPVMFSGMFLSDYFHIRKEKILPGINPSAIVKNPQVNVFELENFRIRTENLISHSYSYYRKGGSSSGKVIVPVYLIPLSDAMENSEEPVWVFATCSSESCHQKIRPHWKFAIRRNKNNTNPEDLDAYNDAFRKKYSAPPALVKMNPVFVRLTPDVYLTGIRMRRYAILIYLGVIVTWIMVSLFSLRFDNKNRIRTPNNVV